MNKIYGYLPVYNMGVWIDYAIKNYLSLVDHLVIGEGYQGMPWDGFKRHSTDNTRKIINKYRDHSKITIIDNPRGLKQLIGLARCHKKALKIFERHGMSVGDWYMICDADEFYNKKQQKIIKDTIKETFADTIKVADNMFAYNFKYYIPSEHYRLFRYTQGMRFYWHGQKPMYADGRFYIDNGSQVILQDNPMFHYSWVQPVWRIRQRCELSVKNGEHERLGTIWYKRFFLQWTEERADDYYDFNKLFTGHNGWFIGDDRKIAKYCGKHPEILDNHPFRNIRDIRDELMKG